LTSDILSWTWVSFTVAATTGFLMFTSAASKYAADTPFRLKMILLLLTGVNMAIFNASPIAACQIASDGDPPSTQGYR